MAKGKQSGRKRPRATTATVTLPPTLRRDGELYGRSALVQKIVRSLRPEAPSSVQRLCLWGPDGIGKTALAQEAARRLAPKFPRILAPEIESSDLEERRTFLFFEALADALGLHLPDESPESRAAGAAERLADDVPTLLVIDRLFDADPTPQAEDWLTQQPANVRILALSPEAWEGADASLPVGPLGPEASIKILADASTAKDRGYLRFAAELLHGHPLRLRLAGGLLAARGSAQRMAELSRLPEPAALQRLLEGHLEDAADPARKVFAILSYFPGRAPREILRAASGLEKKSAAALREAVQRGLVESFDRGKAFGLRPAFRPAAERLWQGLDNRDVVAVQATRRFLPLVQKGGANFFTAQRRNLARLQLGVERRAQPEETIAWVETLLPVSRRARRRADVVRLIELGWSAAGQLEDRAARAAKGVDFAEVLVTTGELERADELFRQALNWSEETFLDGTIMARAYRGLGDLARKRGNFEEAIDHYTRSAEILAASPETERQAVVLSRLCVLEERVGRYEAARRHAQAALTLLERVNLPRGYAAVKVVLAQLASLRGELEVARQHLLQAAARLEKTGEPDLLSRIKYQLGTLLQQLGDNEGARQYFADAFRKRKPSEAKS